jgi:hypothetical protein
VVSHAHPRSQPHRPPLLSPEPGLSMAPKFTVSPLPHGGRGVGGESYPIFSISLAYTGTAPNTRLEPTRTSLCRARVGATFNR